MIRILANDLIASRKSWTSAPQHYTSANDYKVMSLSIVVKGFKKFLEAMNAEIRECMELSPIEKPNDFNKWKSDVMKYINSKKIL